MLTPLVDGYWVSEQFAQIAEVIHDYDSHMELAWIPPEQRTDKTPPYAVMETNGEGKRTLVFTIEEMDLNHTVLARLFRGDTHKNNVLANIEADEIARKALEMKKEMEKAEERQDLIASIAGSPLHTYHHNGKKFQS